MEDNTKQIKANKASEGTLKWMIQSAFGTEAGLMLATLIFLCIDGLHLIFFDPINDYFLHVLHTPGNESIQIILGFYLLYALSLGFVSALKPADLGPVKRKKRRRKKRQKQQKGPPRHWPKLISFWPTWGFGIMMIMVLGELSGWSSDAHLHISDSWEMLAMGGGFCIYMLQLALGLGDLIEPKHDSSKVRYYVYLIPCVIIAELMLNFSFAAWLYFFAPGPDTAPIQDPDMFWAFVIMGPLFYFLFAAPRFIFMRLNFTWMTLASGLALMLYELWRCLQIAPVI